ncbi:hypothetical protein IE81DRAFT_296908 [Ceraceosorus guamensis]|uniref:Phosphatidylinositol 4-kinase n=1 Tax=Ceraceosorus guamensis TaxID=1522189 RepID=A0A316W8K2_9BASI|nr:hypothetical protein IE81DRAFT_296908 [Ceraceosorus guamensis]PWN45884.1 hypothetical protein IE81DRAFT_296908 [Ceraceosorus guamensis]
MDTMEGQGGASCQAKKGRFWRRGTTTHQPLCSCCSGRGLERCSERSTSQACTRRHGYGATSVSPRIMSRLRLLSNLRSADSNVDRVRAAIAQGIYPKMITTGSSGSYFARAPVETQGAQLHVGHEHEEEATVLHQNLETVAVFKPQDEEPYGNLNPKRVFLRKYLWWAMGRPCLIPNFSAFSEVGASYLDVRLELGLVPRTELIELSSPSFHYEFKDRMLWDRERRWPPQKLGSWQTFLPGYRNASDFLRAHPWPSRPRSLLEHDLEAEQRAHSKARKRQSKKLRTCVVSLKNVLLCRQGYEPDDEDDEDEGAMEGGEGTATTEDDEFLWNPDNMQSFRLELEKLVCLDYLQRNTDRGLDNFMLHPYTDEEGKQRIALGAIDNSLAFPHKHPVGIRSYPMGWLYLPVDLIGGPFSASTRASLIPMLSSPRWWLHTVRGLRDIFQRDEHFDAKLFERQMALMRGQGWNLLQSLRSEDEGPLELCARQKQVVKQEKRRMTPTQIADTPGSRVALFQPVTHAQVIIAPPTPAQAAFDDSAKAQAVDVPTASRSEPSTAAAVGAQPRSLPEASAGFGWTAQPGRVPRPGHERGLSNESSYDEGSLGIDVVAERDKAARKAKRPTLRKALTGAVGASMSPSRGRSSARKSSRHVPTSSEEDTFRPVPSPDRSPLATSRLSRAKRNDAGHVEAATSPSIEATLAASTHGAGVSPRSPLARLRHGEEHDLHGSVASLPSASPAPLAPQETSSGRPRGASVSSWSIASFAAPERDRSQRMVCIVEVSYQVFLARRAVKAARADLTSPFTCK